MKQSGPAPSGPEGGQIVAFTESDGGQTVLAKVLLLLLLELDGDLH
jgi:hypothetical protein